MLYRGLQIVHDGHQRAEPWAVLCPSVDGNAWITVGRYKNLPDAKAGAERYLYDEAFKAARQNQQQ